MISIVFYSNMITIYGKDYCPYCDAAKGLAETLGAEYEYIDVFSSPETEQKHKELSEKYSHYTVPGSLSKPVDKNHFFETK
jgi:glutaredoxin